MESVVASSELRSARILRRLDLGAVCAWFLVVAILLYLAFDGGGYDILVRSQLGIVVWWVVLVGAAWGLLPVSRVTGSAWAALALFSGFLAWTALATTWSQSTERSLDEVSRVACYLGILLLGLAIHRDRARAVRQTVSAVGAAIVVVAALATLSRLHPGLFPGAEQTAIYMPGTAGRLNWPLNYWNALAALMALGLPLLLSLATSARTLLGQAAAAAGIPVLALCGYLTFSRGGSIAAGVALVAFLALAPERIPKLFTALSAAAGSAVLIAGAVHRHAIEQGFTGPVARHQGSSLLVAVILVCAGVAMVQVGVGLAARHGTLPRLLRVSVPRARLLFGAGVVLCVVAALALGVPAKLSHEWQDFKRPPTAALSQNTLSRFGQASGNGRYVFWRTSVKATADGHLLKGFGPGTFQLVWLPRAPFYSYIQNAHSLYVETLSDGGIVALALLVAFFLVLIGSAIRVVARTRFERRTAAAGVAAALLAFSTSAAFDWVWQVPVLPACFLLLGAAVLVARRPSLPRAGLVVRPAIVLVSVACLIAIAVPLATASAVRKSQTASARGEPGLALADAVTGTRLEPGAASPHLQESLVLEQAGDKAAALAAIQPALADEPENWSIWLVDSRLQAENGHTAAALSAYRRARALNPRSPLFRHR